jgi:hypothetical protein
MTKPVCTKLIYTHKWKLVIATKISCRVLGMEARFVGTEITSHI